MRIEVVNGDKLSCMDFRTEIANGGYCFDKCRRFHLKVEQHRDSKTKRKRKEGKLYIRLILIGT